MNHDRSMTRAARLLRAWEHGSVLPHWERALLLAADAVAIGAPAAEEYGDPGELRRLPVGHTHRLVLLWRADEIGPTLTGTAGCPACGCVIEFVLEVARLLDSKPIQSSGALVHGDHTIDWRCPTPEDLMAVTVETEPLSALRSRCVSVRGEVDPPASVWRAVDRQLAEADPLAEIVVDLACAECAEVFAARIDPVAFVWAELEATAVRVLHEVDLLARAYGWAEADILALGDIRRTAYLRLVVDGAP